MVDDVEDVTDVPGVESEAMRSAIAEVREMMLDRNTAPVVNITNTPPAVTVDARQEPAVVNVDNRMDLVPPAVTVVNNVEPTPVTIDNRVDVSPTPVTIDNRVDVSPTPVTVEAPRTKHTVRRDAAGNIVEVVEEPA